MVYCAFCFVARLPSVFNILCTCAAPSLHPLPGCTIAISASYRNTARLLCRTQQFVRQRRPALVGPLSRCPFQRDQGNKSPGRLCAGWSAPFMLVDDKHTCCSIAWLHYSSDLLLFCNVIETYPSMTQIYFSERSHTHTFQ